MTIFILEADSPRAIVRSATDNAGTKYLAGDCNRCGQCCEAVDCRFLEFEMFDDERRAVCKIYSTRPVWCALWPEPDDKIPDDCGFQWLNK